MSTNSRMDLSINTENYLAPLKTLAQSLGVAVHEIPHVKSEFRHWKVLSHSCFQAINIIDQHLLAAISISWVGMSDSST